MGGGWSGRLLGKLLGRSVSRQVSWYVSWWVSSTGLCIKTHLLNGHGGVVREAPRRPKQHLAAHPASRALCACGRPVGLGGLPRHVHVAAAGAPCHGVGELEDEGDVGLADLDQILSHFERFVHTGVDE